MSVKFLETLIKWQCALSNEWNLDGPFQNHLQKYEKIDCFILFWHCLALQSTTEKRRCPSSGIRTPKLGFIQRSDRF